MTKSQAIKYEKITPILDRLLIKPINLKGENADAEQSLLREIAQKKILNQKVGDFEITKAMNNCGVVCAASVDCPWVAMDDIVFFGQYSGTEVLIESERHLMIRESDILFILKP
jgi:co-chaperonin GroES (HSP10)